MSDDSDQPSGEATYGLILSFPDQSHSFVHGYEAGLLAARMKAGEAEIDSKKSFPFHRANLELFRRMATLHGYELVTDKVTAEGHADDAFDTYINCTFTKVEGQRKVKPTLRVV